MRGALIAALLAVLATNARAQSPAALIDRDATMVVAGSPADIGDMLDSVGKLGHGLMIGLARQGLKSTLGWDLGDPRSWAARGFDVAGDIWLSLTVDDSEARYNALSATASWTAKTAAGTPLAMWHLRLIAPVTAGRRVRALAEAWGRRVALGRGNVRIRQAGKYLVVDVLRPMFPGAGAQPKASDITARARPPRPGQSFDRGATVARPGLRGWMRAGALIAIGRTLQRELHIELQRDRTISRGTGPWKPNPRCVELASIVDGHLFTELSWHLSPIGPTVEVTLGAASRAALDKAFPRASARGQRAHRLPNLTAAAALRVAGYSGLRALPRPGVLRSFTDALAHIKGCEKHYGWTARLFGWPHMIGLFFDEIAALGPRGKILAQSVSSASGGTSDWNRAPFKITGVLEGALAGPGIAPARSLLDQAFVKGRGDTWGVGRMRVTLQRGTPPVLSTSLGGDRGAKLWTRAPGSEWVDPSAIAALRIDLEAGRTVLRGWEPRLSALGNAKKLSVDLRPIGQALRVRFALSP